MNDICRLCLGTGKLISIFSSDNSIQISLKIMSCAAIKVLEDDNLPSSICPKCIKRLNNSYKFKLQCEESDQKLRNVYKISNGTENSEPDVGYEDIEEVNYSSDGEKIEKPIDEPASEEKTEISPSKTRSGKRLTKDIAKAKNSKTKVSSTRGPKKLLDESLLYIDDDILENKILEAKMLEDIQKRELKAQKRKERREREKVLKPKVEKEKKESNVRPKGKTKAEMMEEEKEKRLLLRKSKLNMNSASYCGNNQCYTCGKIVSSRFRLKMHMRTHTGERPYACSYCSKTFALAQNLKVHERTHTGEKPLLCVICGKTFAQSAGLVAHTRLHTGETPYRCDICPSSFRTPGHLQYHIRQHTGEKNFECGICNRAFITKGDLTQHYRTHTGERPYVCTVCGLRMSRSSHLTRHMLTHTGEKPHKCHICGTAYAQKGDLVRHVKKHDMQSQTISSGNCLIPIDNTDVPNTNNGQLSQNQQNHTHNSNVVLQSNLLPVNNVHTNNGTALSIEQNRLMPNISLPVVVQNTENSDFRNQVSIVQTGMIDRLIDSRNILDNRTQMAQLDARTLGLGLGLGLLHTHHV